MEQEHVCMSEYDFVLVLTGVNDLSEAVTNALFEAGCDDATPSLRRGTVTLTFSRTAPSMKAAVLSAIRAVEGAGVGAMVDRVDDCCLVTQSEIARKSNRSRQVVSQYISGARGPGNFPTPVCHLSDDSPLWMWCAVAYWLWANGMIRESDLREAQEVSAINAVLELRNYRRAFPELTAEIVGSVGC